MDAIQIGKTYVVDDNRKGRYLMEVTRFDNDFVTGILRGDRAVHGLSTVWNPGDQISTRRGFSKFTLTDEAPTGKAKGKQPKKLEEKRKVVKKKAKR